jgi:tubulin polyglutamylase TTLL4
VRRPDDETEKVENSKWSLPFFVRYCQEAGIDSVALFKEFERITTATLVAGMSTIQSHHQRHLPHRYASYEQLGLDLLVDESMRVSVLEVNVSPSMSGMDSKLDYEIKARLMHDLLTMARIIDCDAGAKDPCPGVELVERECKISLKRQREVAVKAGKVSAWDDPVFADYTVVRDFVEEQGRRNGYRRLFPRRKALETFMPCYSQLSYLDVVQAQWIRLGKEERIRVLEKNWAAYSEKLASFCTESIAA